MRDGYTRAREIEESASGLVAWCDEFVSEVQDYRGSSLYVDFREMLAELRESLNPLDEDPDMAANKDKRFWDTEEHLTRWRR